MDELPKNIWKQLARVFPANESESERAAELFREYESSGYLERPAAELIGCAVPLIADFFRRVSLMHSPESPVRRRRDTRWMSEFDYTLVNIRAAGLPGCPGTFLRAAIFLTTVRTQAIITAPLTSGPKERLDYVGSHVIPREELVDAAAREAGFSADLQLAAFREAAHMLGLVIGCDLDYRVDPMAAVVLNRPEFFFWTKEGRFNPDEAAQDTLRQEVRERVKSVKRTGAPHDPAVFSAALGVSGLAPRLSADGSGRTPFALRRSIENGTGEHREAAAAYWTRVFDPWRDRFGFDFLMLRGTRESRAAHESRSAGGTSESREASDNMEVPDLSLVRRAADAARKAGVRRNIGVAAEGWAEDVESFGVHGVDLVIGDRAEDKADRQWFSDVFSLDDHLRRINLGRKLRFSVPISADPGERESRSRRERALIKRFVARFLGCGPSRRPLLETMGALEGAWGYAKSLEAAASLGWMPDAEDAARGRSIENVARDFREMTVNGERLERHLSERTAWWVLRSRRGLLIAVVSVENEDLLPPEPLRIDYSAYLKEAEVMSVVEFDFREDRGMLRLSADTVIDAGPVPYRGFRLYAVT